MFEAFVSESGLFDIYNESTWQPMPWFALGCQFRIGDHFGAWQAPVESACASRLGVLLHAVPDVAEILDVAHKRMCLLLPKPYSAFGTQY